jgi:hypothetical protein
MQTLVVRMQTSAVRMQTSVVQDADIVTPLLLAPAQLPIEASQKYLDGAGAFLTGRHLKGWRNRRAL